MMNAEKVISDLEQCLDDSVAAVVPADTVREAITLLKAQEHIDAIPVEWIQAQVENEKRAPLFRRYAEALMTIWQMEQEAIKNGH